MPDFIKRIICGFLAPAASLVFWLIEALWKSFQYMYSPRIERLERAFASDDFSGIAPFQVYTSWFETLQKQGFGVAGNFRLGIVAFPHFITLIAGIVLFVLSNCADRRKC